MTTKELKALVYRNILGKIFKAWIIQNESYDSDSGEDKIKDYEAHKMACDGDEDEAALLELFSHWSNDLQTVAPHFGIALVTVDGKLVIREDVPPPPTNKHYWDTSEAQWVEYVDDDETEASPLDT